MLSEDGDVILWNESVDDRAGDELLFVSDWTTPQPTNRKHEHKAIENRREEHGMYGHLAESI